MIKREIAGIESEIVPGVVVERAPHGVPLILTGRSEIRRYAVKKRKQRLGYYQGVTQGLPASLEIGKGFLSLGESIRSEGGVRAGARVARRDNYRLQGIHSDRIRLVAEGRHAD
jgi:hypothetical protein